MPPVCGPALLWMRQVSVLVEILPETEKWGIDAIPALIATEQALGWSADPLLRLASIVPPDTARLTAMAERLRLSKADAGRLLAWAAAPLVSDEISTAALARLLYQHGAEGIRTRLKLALAIARGKADGDLAEMARTARLGKLLDSVERWEKPVFPIGGADALQAGLAPGRRVGEILAAIEQQWVEGNFAMDRAALLARLKELA
jgi:poly(A) polymerase